MSYLVYVKTEGITAVLTLSSLYNAVVCTMSHAVEHIYEKRAHALQLAQKTVQQLLTKLLVTIY